MRVRNTKKVNLKVTGDNIRTQIRKNLRARANESSKELAKKARIVLGGVRAGRKYKSPRKKHYIASSPGSPPAQRTNAFRRSWRPRTRYNKPGIETRSKAYLARWLEGGTDNRSKGKRSKGKVNVMKARPFTGRILDEAWPQIKSIYRRPHL